MPTNKYRKDKTVTAPASINLGLQVQDIEYTSRSLNLFVTNTDNYINRNLKIVQDLQDKWLRSQEQTRKSIQKYQDSNVEDIFDSVINNIIDEFILDLQNVEASILTTKTNLSKK